MIFIPETPLASLMRIEKMSLNEAKRDFRKRLVDLRISFNQELQKWNLCLYKNDELIFQKHFSRTCQSDILNWFLVYDLDRDQSLSIKIPWKQIMLGKSWMGSVFINRRIWKKLELPTDLQLCEIYQWRPRQQPAIKKSFGMVYEMGIVLPMRAR